MLEDLEGNDTNHWVSVCIWLEEGHGRRLTFLEAINCWKTAQLVLAWKKMDVEQEFGLRNGQVVDLYNFLRSISGTDTVQYYFYQSDKCLKLIVLLINKPL